LDHPATRPAVLPSYCCSIHASTSARLKATRLPILKLEAADRPLRVNEVADLARILGTRLPDLVSANSDWNRKGINLMLSHFQGHAARLRMDIDELNQQLAAKTQAYEEAQERVRELQRDLDSVDGEH
jgi:hypothetical protein